MTAPGWLRAVSLCEGISLLLLLFVAMPLKYAYGMPLAVRIAGSIHGALFLALLSVCFQVALDKSLTKWTLFKVLALSLVPFGFVVADRLIRSTTSAPVPAD